MNFPSFLLFDAGVPSGVIAIGGIALIIFFVLLLSALALTAYFIIRRLRKGKLK